MAIGGVVVTYGSTILAIAMPLVIKSLCVNQAGWTTLALAIGIPSIILAGLRFFVIKELPLTNAEGEVVKEEKVTVGQIVKQLIHNKYVLICMGLIFTYYFGQNISTVVTSYYFTYNIGNLDLLSVISATALFAPIALLFIPKLLSKFGKAQVLQMG